LGFGVLPCRAKPAATSERSKLPEDHVIGVDLGGTKILVGLVARDGTIVSRSERPTPLDSQEALVTALEAVVRELLDERVGALGLGVPSRIDQAAGVAHGSVNIPLHTLPLRDRMAELFGLPVAIENDGNAAALAEWAIGAGRGSRNLVMFTLGTGVGGGVILDGRLYRGWAELGHMVVDYDGRPCQGTCTGRGHVESYCTGVAAAKDAAAAFGPDTDAYDLIRLARDGDGEAREILAEIGRRLGAGIGSAVNVFNPEVVVVGGGFGGAAAEFLLEPAREVVLREALAPAGETVRIEAATLGAQAGLIGAALVAFEAFGSA
jgi:glucokinase